MKIANSTYRFRGRLKLNVPGAAVPDTLPPILSAFTKKHPEVDVEVVVENDLVVDHQPIRFRLHGGSLMLWILQRGEEEVTVEANPNLVISVNALDSALRYARAGIGIIGAFENWCDEDFRTASLFRSCRIGGKFSRGRACIPSRLASAPLRAIVEMCRARKTNDTNTG